MFKFLKKTATSFWEKAANVALAYIINVVWAIGVIKFYNWLFESGYSTFQFGSYKREKWIEIVAAVLMAPLLEEILCRKLPLDIVKYSGKEKELLIPVMLFTSVVFGLMHSGGLWSVPLQGVGGFILASIYVKNGYSYWSSVILHAMWNAGLVFGVLNL